MPVSAEDFKAALSKLDNGDELLEFHTASVNAEKDRGIQSRREANREAQHLRRFKIAMEKLGFDPKDESADIEAFVDNIAVKMEADTTKATGELAELQATLKKLQREFEKGQKELTTEREQRSQLQQQNRIKTIESKLAPKLQEEFYGAPFIVKSLIADGMVDLDEAGDVLFKKGDEQLSMADGLKWLQETNADARRNKQNGGAGSAGGSVQPNRPKFSLEQIKSMTPQQMQANIADVNESMRQLQATK